MSDSSTAIRRHLTFDEIERWGDASYRIRVWQGSYVDAMALVSQVGRGSHPKQDVVAIANYVNEAILRYPTLGFSMFMDGANNLIGLNPARVLEYVGFEFFGCRHRLRLFKPTCITRDWKFLTELVGGEIDR